MTEVALDAYREEIEQWRAARERALAAPDGWLSLAGLYPITDGDYTIGSSDDNDLVLPGGVPAHLGRLRVDGGQAALEVTADVLVTVDEAEVQHVTMVDNTNGRTPTLVRVGTLSLNLHRFGEELALRVRDNASPAIQTFQGCRWYAIQPEYRVQGALVRQPMTAITVATSVKTVAQYQSIGTVEFELLGQRLVLRAAAAPKATELFIIFRDATAGKSTYGAGRYLYAPVDNAGMVILDFNKAYNPPCAFTPYATCSLPPTENSLRVTIEAGELYPAA